MSGFHDEYIKRILGARVYDVSRETRLHEAPNLSARLGNTVWFKREDEQTIFSFKCRGAFNRIHRLLDAGALDGVIAASAGNHAQGVALAARTLGLPALIVMPVTTPPIKIDAVRALGAEVVLHGDDFGAALEHAHERVAASGYAFIHPFDSPDTIAGQGTVAVELCRQRPGPIHAVFVPVGGGGLASGVAAYLKYLRPDVRVIGVEPVDAACMHAALEAGQPVTLPQVGLFADGVAVRRAGDETFRVCREFLDEIVLVTVDEMSAAIKDIFTDTRTLMEPAGALALAGLKRYAFTHGLEGRHLVAITSGANINFDRLRHVAERAEIGESREALFAVRIPEESGSFRRFCETLGRRSITEFNYRYADAERAVVFAGIEINAGAGERERLAETLSGAGYEVLDMTDNDAAKLHVRFMIGGVADLDDERLFRFRFPERPGALLDFLNGLGRDWNITLFHYRNHGAAYGRVLVGIQLPRGQDAELRRFLDRLPFPAEEESDNAAYRSFLRPARPGGRLGEP